MTVRTIVLAALAATAAAGSALADERIDITPPLYREQARATAETRPMADLTTTPRAVPVPAPRPRLLTEATAR